MNKETKTDNYVKAQLKVKDEYIKQLSSSLEQLKKEVEARNKTIESLKRDLYKERNRSKQNDLSQPLESW